MPPGSASHSLPARKPLLALHSAASGEGSQGSLKQEHFNPLATNEAKTQIRRQAIQTVSPLHVTGLSDYIRHRWRVKWEMIYTEPKRHTEKENTHTRESEREREREEELLTEGRILQF